MVYSENLADRVRKLLSPAKGYDEKKMFGGVCFLLNGNMACGILNSELIVRVGPDKHEDMLDMPHVREFDVTGKSMKGWIMVDEEGIASSKNLRAWVDRGAAFAKSLPPKQK